MNLYLTSKLNIKVKIVYEVSGYRQNLGVLSIRVGSCYGNIKQHQQQQQQQCGSKISFVLLLEVKSTVLS